MNLTDHEQALVLAGLFELRISHLEDDERCAEIDVLAAKLSGDPSAMFFGVNVTRN
jgi:hypothetical protein